ncbi:MAG: S-layer homology domain-containing protein [Clostridia bacterium]|nr:S-layer homology domain-containing protein [Clostridia bacterium]
MIKRIAIVFLSICMIFSSLPALAAKVLTEQAETYTWADGWGVGAGGYATEKRIQARVTDKEAYEGKYSMEIFNKMDKSSRVWYQLYGLEPGKTYTVSSYAKISKKVNFSGTGMMIRITPEYKSGQAAAYALSDNVTDAQKWTKLTAQFEAPEDGLVVVCLDTGALPEGVSVFWDQMEVSDYENPLNGGFEDVITIEPLTVTIPDGATDFMVDENGANIGGFENGTAGWNAYKGWKDDNPMVSITSEEKHSGNYAVKLHYKHEFTEKYKDDPNYKNPVNPWISQMIEVEPATEYVMVFWVKATELGKRFVSGGEGSDAAARVKFEFYSEPRSSAETSLGYEFLTSQRGLVEAGKGWVEVFQTFQTPAGCHGVAFYPRLYGEGTVYFDDFQLYKTQIPKMASFETDWVFYYPDFKTGTATVKPTPNMTEIESKTVSFALMDGNTVVCEQPPRAFENGAVSFTYPTDALKTKMQERFDVVARIHDGSGNVIEEHSTDVYMYPRPNYLPEDGIFRREGEPFYPIFSYHHNSKYYEEAKEGGINSVQITFQTEKEFDNSMKKIREAGMMAMVALYRNGGGPIFEDNIDSTRRILEKYKNDPNILCWMVQDEPFGKLPYFDCIEMLKDSYKFIRDIDPNHPVYINDNQDITFNWSSKFCDILATDPYPTSSRSKTTYVTSQMQKARESVQSEKPVWAILQAYRGGFLPSSEEIRSMAYQALFVGARAIGYYTWGEADQNENGENIRLNQVEMWDGIKSLAQVELPVVYEAFSGMDTPTFTEGRAENAWYRCFIKDGKLYMAVISRLEKEETTIEIPLTSGDGSVKIGACTAKCIGGDNDTFTGDGTLSVSLNPCGAKLYEIIANGVDFSTFVPCQYLDLGDYAWARNQIENLREKNISNENSPMSYAPARNITRAEFAGFLIRALDLTAAENEQFADVSKDNEFAKEIAIGKAIGILKGTDGVNYNPDEAISRQDLMVICARGMRLIKELGQNVDLTSFADSASIAEYAKADIAAMVDAGIVKGNPDGTVNPLGNTTRAEAAVIMSRILSWK